MRTDGANNKEKWPGIPPPQTKAGLYRRQRGNEAAKRRFRGCAVTVLDQVLGHVPAALGRPGMTAYLNTTYERPTPLGRVSARAWLTGQDGWKMTVTGELLALRWAADSASAAGVSGVSEAGDACDVVGAAGSGAVGAAVVGAAAVGAAVVDAVVAGAVVVDTAPVEVLTTLVTPSRVRSMVIVGE